MKRKKMTALLLTGILAVSAAVPASAAVSGANEDPVNTEKTEETLHIAMASEPSALWPAAAGKVEAEAEMISAALMDTLVKVDSTSGEVEPNLATEWNWVDSTHCQFTLRDDVTMSDGTPLTAEDVVYDVNDIWIANNAANDTGMYLAGAVADDEHTVTIEFNTEAPDMLAMLSWENFGIVSEAEIEAAGGLEAASRNPVVGCGKYKLVEWVNGQSITITRNEDYWNPDYAGYYKNIVFTFTNDAAARAMAVQSGDVDVAYDIPVLQAAGYAESDDVKTVLYENEVNSLWYNMTDGHATADLNVRQAIDLALDFDAIAQAATAGYGKAAQGYFLENSPYYTETYTAEERAVDVEKAKSLLEEAGYGDGLDLTAIALATQSTEFTVIQECLRAVGINLTVNTLDSAGYVEDGASGNYDMIIICDYTESRFPTAFCFLNRETIESFVIGGTKTTTDEIDAKIDEYIKAEDTDTAKAAAQEIEQLMKADTMASYLYVSKVSSVINKDLKGYSLNSHKWMDVTSFY